MLTKIFLISAMLQFPESATHTASAPARGANLAGYAWQGRELPSGGERLTRAARPGTYFDAVGNCSFLCGTEDGPLEAWIWPWQILYDGRFSFRPAKALDALDLHHYAAEIEVAPEATDIIYKSADAFVKVKCVCPRDVPAILLLLTIDIDQPGTLAFSFQPKLQPQWPAAIGGVAAKWTPDLGGFVISEPSARVAAVVGSPWSTRATEGMQYLLPNGALRLEIDVDPARCKKEILPIVIAAVDGPEALKIARDLYTSTLLDGRELAAKNLKFWAGRLASMTTISTDDAQLDRAFLWNSISLEQGLVKSRALGDGLVAAYGPAGASSQRPGFAWFFTGDVGVNAIAYLDAGLADTLATGLRFAAAHQRADGKIPHEVVLSAHLCNWFEKYPFAYIHGETTALWIHAVRQYVDFTGDRKLLAELWPSLLKAYDWLSNQDDNGDELPENAKAGMGASEIGPLRDHLQTDMYLAATAAAAFSDMVHLATLQNDTTTAGSASERANVAKSSIIMNFWDETAGSYAHAMLTDHSLSKERTVWPACAVLYGIAPLAQAADTMLKIDAPALSTPWGVRILSNESAYFEPKGYNTGAVWPFVTGLAALADFEIGRANEGLQHITSVVNLTFAEALGRTPEVLSGTRPRSLDTSVPHQLFSSMAVVAPVIHGIFGYQPNATENKLTIAPCFPSGWTRAKARNLQFGAARIDLDCAREGDTYQITAAVRGGPAPEIILLPKNGAAGKVTIKTP